MKTKNDPMARDRRVGIRWLERQALALAAMCPVERSNPSNCPLFGVRTLGARERRAWIHGLSHEDLEYLISYHACCVAARTAAKSR